MAENLVIRTTVGLAKLASASAGHELVLREFAVGDGGGNPVIPNPNMTALVNEKYRSLLTSVRSEDNKLIVECVLSASAPIDTGFNIREIGLFDDSGDLIAIASVTSNTFRAPTSSGSAIELKWNVVVESTNGNNVTVELTEQIFATQTSLEREVTNRTAGDTNLNSTLTALTTRLEALENLNTSQQQDLANYKAKRVGSLFFHGSTSAPVGALACDGALIDITAYQNLFNVIGHSFNEGVDPGNGKFKLPSSQDRYLRGLGSTGIVGTYEEDSIKSHDHSLNPHNHIMNHRHSMTHGHGNSRHSHNIDHNHGMPDLFGDITFDRSPVRGAGGVFHSGGSGGEVWGGSSPGCQWNNRVYFQKSGWRTMDHRGNTSSDVININNFNGNTAQYTGYTSNASLSTNTTGESETRVKGFRALICIWYQ